MDVIAAIATGASPTAIGIVRVSGDGCFPLCGRVFHPAKAWIERSKMYVKSDSVKKPVAVRYAFKDWADGDLFCDGLPVSSFRTDNWDE